MSDISDYEQDEQEKGQLVLPAFPEKGPKRKAGGLGKKGKVFASKDRMLEMVDRINTVQEQKVGILVERDVTCRP